MIASSSTTWRLVPILVLAGLLAEGSAVGLGADTGRMPSVVLLMSLRSNAPAVSVGEHAFRTALESDFGAPVDLHVEYLDLPGQATPAYAERLTDLLVEKYRGRPVDVVVVQRAEGLEYLLPNRQTLFPGVPVVFMDVSPEDLERLAPPRDVTGAVHVIRQQRTFEAAADLVPSARQVVLVGGGSRFDLEIIDVARSLIDATGRNLTVLSLAGLPLDEQLRRVANLDDDSLVIFTSYRGDALGRSMVAGDVLELVARASSVPTFGAAGPWIGHGIVGGDLIQYGRLAERAAALVSRLLKGEPVTTIAPTAEASTALTFDWRQLRRWGIPESRLPAGSQVLFREPTLWSTYRWHFIGVGTLLAAQLLLIGAMLVGRRHRRRAQEALAESEQRYRTVVEFTEDWIYWAAPDGTFRYVSPSCGALTGYEAAEFLAQSSLLDDIVDDEDRTLWVSHRRQMRDAPARGSLQFRIRTKDGAVRWIDHVCTPVRGVDGQFLGTRGSNRDITARKWSEDALRRAVEEIGRLRDRLESDNTYLREQLASGDTLEGVVGASEVMQYVVSKVRQVAPTPSTVLLLGETGVGKGLIAQAIHTLSPRKERPLVTLDCAALPPSLIETELFGHERGAFTGAHARRPGRFEVASGGTLFLDEIGELPLDLQGKLLRAVQDGEFERVGGQTTVRTDVRLIAATNRDMHEEVRAGRFRQDLWYRLNVYPITVPPLRQRVIDIPLLVMHFLEKHCARLGRPAPDVSKATIKTLQTREWPGNVRELENVVERALISNPGAWFEIGEIEEEAGVFPPQAPAAAADDPRSRHRTLTEIERAHIVATLERLHWKVEGAAGAAAALGMNASTLRSRMRKHGIARPATPRGLAR